MLNPMLKEEKVRFEINLQTVERHGLHIRSKPRRYPTLAGSLNLTGTR